MNKYDIFLIDGDNLSDEALCAKDIKDFIKLAKDDLELFKRDVSLDINDVEQVKNVLDQYVVGVDDYQYFEDILIVNSFRLPRILFVKRGKNENFGLI